MEKRIFTSSADLKTYLTSKGFTIYNNNSRMRWHTMSAESTAYWTIDANGDFNFHPSVGGNAFLINLTDFTSATRSLCGCVFIPLLDNGCILYLTSLPNEATINDLTLSCANTYTYDEETGDPIIDTTATLHNGIVVCTPPEQDGYWRCGWRDQDNSSFFWDIDDTHNKTSKGTELPSKLLIQVNMNISLVRVYLNSGYWSNYIFEEPLGETQTPSAVFKINGQRYISITDNTTYRCPVFRLPAQTVIPNPSASTEEYSSIKTYKTNDYCIYNGLLWKCNTAITLPEPFDNAKWDVTTVHQEIMAE